MNSSYKKSIFISHLLIWGSVLAIAIFIAWAQWAQIDQITRAQGQVIASSRNQIIQAMEGGMLTELPVREGAQVKQGQLLVRFDKTKAESAYLESRAKAAALMTTIARLKAELYGGTPQFPPEAAEYPEFRNNQLTLFTKRRKALTEEISALKKMEDLIREELELNLPLVETGDVSKADILRFRRQMIDIRNQITNKENKYLQDSQTEMAKAEEDLAGVMQVLAQRKDQLNSMEIFAPMDGVIRNVRITTLGGVAKPGEEIMQIVPVDDVLIIEAKVRPADIAFITTGLPASVKFDAYDYTIYGTLPGKVSYISADTLTEEVRGTEQSYYRVQVKIDSPRFSGKQDAHLNIQPGMTTTVEIKTGKKTVFHYLAKPITKTLSESLGER